MELKRCFAVARRAYNFANERIRKDKKRANFMDLRNEWTKQPPPAWASTPTTAVATRIQQNAIKQCVDAYASNAAIAKTKAGHSFVVNYRGLRSTTTEVIGIEKDEKRDIQNSRRKRFEPVVTQSQRRSECWLHLGNNLATHGGIRLQDSGKVIEMLLQESSGLKENAKIQWDKRLQKFYFVYAYEQPKLKDPDPLFEWKRIVATDPGNTPFQEWYSPTSGEYGVLLDGDVKEQKKARCATLDALQSRIDMRRKRPDRIPSQRRCENGSWRQQQHRYRRTTRRLRKRFWRESARMSGWMANGHYAAANFLLGKHEIVIQPILQVKRLATGHHKRMNSQGVRNMYTWSHYQFRQRLKSAATRYSGRHVYETTEPGTSKTCTHCGFWHANLRLGDKVYDCPRCHIQVDRQLAGARNNFFAAYGLAVGRGWDGG